MKLQLRAYFFTFSILFLCPFAYSNVQKLPPHLECKEIFMKMGTIQKPFELIEVEKDIFLLSFNNNKEMAYTFLRFQEFYESPHFQGKTFSRSKYKKWYRSAADKPGHFSYGKDWEGFNIPSSVLKHFYEGRFKKLSQRELSLLELFKSKKDSFYIIGAVKGVQNALDHEISHGRFFINPAYRNDILSVLSRYDISAIEAALRSDNGYAESVLKDEVHSYILNDQRELVKSYNIEVSKYQNLYADLKAVELKHYPKTKE